MRPVPTGVIQTACLVNLGLGGLSFLAAARTASATLTAVAIQSVATAFCLMLVLKALATEARAPVARSRLDVLFWAVVAPVLLFPLAAGIAIERGVARLGGPAPAIERLVAYGTLAAGLMALALVTARLAQGFAPNRGRKRDGLAGSTLYALLLQCLAGLMTLAIALVGLGLMLEAGWRGADAVTSIAAGLVMGGLAALMAMETRLLIAPEAAVVEAAAPADGDHRPAGAHPTPSSEVPAGTSPEARERAASRQPSGNDSARRKRRGRR